VERKGWKGGKEVVNREWKGREEKGRKGKGREL